MTRGERVGMWGLVAGLVVYAYGASLRIDTLTGHVVALARSSTTTTSVSSSTVQASPLEAAVAELRRQVTELRATRGLSGPEVRRLVETLLPAPGCVEPPCDAPATGPGAGVGSTTTPTTVKK